MPPHGNTASTPVDISLGNISLALRPYQNAEPTQLCIPIQFLSFFGK